MSVYSAHRGCRRVPRPRRRRAGGGWQKRVKIER